MTVEKLIEKLRELPPEAEVLVLNAWSSPSSIKSIWTNARPDVKPTSVTLRWKS
jgi:hypothetical protein